MKRKPPVEIMSSAGIICVVLLGTFWSSISSLAQASGLGSVPGALRHPWFAVPLLVETALAGFLIAVVLYGWRWARLALLIALLLWLPEVVPSEERAQRELQYPLGIWFAWFAVVGYAGALALLLTKPAAAHFRSGSSTGTSEA